MTEGEIVLARLPQSDGNLKSRPVVVLKQMPGFGDLLVCGISTQLRHEVPGFDDIVSDNDDDFSSSGLSQPSLIRLGFLGLVPVASVVGSIGSISQARHARLTKRLSDFLIDPN